MTDLQATLDAIDELAVQQCGQCSRPIPVDGESPDFCDSWCQQEWTERHNEIVELVGYREPDDLPMHAANLAEMYSPETASPTGDLRELRGRSGELRVRFDFGWSQLEDSIASMVEWMDRYQQDIDNAAVRLALGWQARAADWAIVDEIHDWRPLGILNTPGVRLIEPEPLPDPLPFDYTWRPVPHLHGDPLPPLMPDPPERDWQALLDTARPHPPAPHRARPWSIDRTLTLGRSR